MTIAVLDDFLAQHSPRQAVPVSAELIKARVSLRSALAALRSVPDIALEKPWPWRGQELDVRYAFYAQLEALEGAKAEVKELTVGRDSAPARGLVGLATAARWDLHGLLTGLDDADLDRDPGNGEWTLRRTLAHVVNGQRAYAWGTGWWFTRRDAPADDFPLRLPAELIERLPKEETEADGTLDEIMRRLDDILDQSAGAFAGLDDDGLAARARWAGHPVDVRFRIIRWSSHIREHTIQLEKTLGFIDRPTTEVERLLRQIASAYGRLEEELYMRMGVDAALAIVEARLAEVAESAATAPTAAG